MDKYLVDPFARWIVHSTGWALSKSKAWARAVIVVVVIVVSVAVFFAVDPDVYL